MTPTKSERLVNLVILLLVTRSYATKERIREGIEAYQQASDTAFEKMFERDKDELRALGVPIEVGYLDKFFEDEQGYRIKRDAFELPEIDFTPDEAAVLGLAAQVWQHAGLASATSAALVKLKAAGAVVDRVALDTLAPRLSAPEPAFDVVWAATLSRTPIEFDYRRPGQEVRRRQVQPWGVATAQGRWYVVGFDTDRAERRVFRLSRIIGEVVPSGRPGSYDVPAGVDLHRLAESLAPPRDRVSATLLVRRGSAAVLRRRGELMAEDVPGPPASPADVAWDRVRIAAVPDELVEDVVSLADAVVVEGPAEFRADVAKRLEVLAGAGDRR